MLCIQRGSRTPRIVRLYLIDYQKPFYLFNAFLKETLNSLSKYRGIQDTIENGKYRRLGYIKVTVAKDHGTNCRKWQERSHTQHDPRKTGQNFRTEQKLASRLNTRRNKAQMKMTYPTN